MYTFTILLCFVPLLANCAKTLHKGLCPRPPPAEKASKLVDVDGTWKTNLDSYEELKEKPMECAKYVLKAIGTPNKGFYKNYVYKRSNKNYKTDQTFVPNKNFTKWYSTTKNKTTGKYVWNGWIYTVVKIEGEGKNKGVLEYACKNEGEYQHKSFYHIYGRENPPNAKTQKALEKAYKEVGDGRKMFKINWDNCD